MKPEYHFDVSRIEGIRIVPVTKDTDYEWLPRKNKTKFFGLLTSKEFFEEGFYEYGYYNRKRVSVKDLERWNRIVLDKEVFRKAQVSIRLIGDRSTTLSFSTNEEAVEYVEKLKTFSGKTFAVIEG